MYWYDQEKRLIIGFFVLYMMFCFIMDIQMYYRVQDFAVRPIKDSLQYESSIPCDLNPFCVVTVKGLMLDYLNFYIFGPLAALFDKIFELSSWQWLSPNYISYFHVFVACIAGKLISNKSLWQRRLGVIVFQMRSWLDDFDGLVARKRKHISGERSDVGSTGYFVDAICDALGSTALIIGILYYLKSTSSRRTGYVRLQPQLPSVAGCSIGSCVVQKKKIRQKNVIPTVLFITGTLITSSLAWNRYIDLYQKLLETDNINRTISTENIYDRQTHVMRSNSFWIITTSWRLISPHALTDYILVAVFVDRLWQYMHSVRWITFIIIFALVYFSDFHYIQSYGYVWDIESSAVSDNAFFNNTNP